MGRRATFLVLLGAALVSVALTVGVLVQGPVPAPVSAPEPVEPVGGSPSPPPSQATTTPAASSGSPTESPTVVPPPTSSASAPATSSAEPTATRQATPFSAVAGPACPVDSTKGTRISTGWQVVPGDSWTGDGCGDRFLYTTPEEQNYLQWLFTFDAPAVRTCRFEVFIPDSPLASAVVWYGVGDQLNNGEYRIGGFTVDQKANRGQWVTAATLPVDQISLLINVDGENGRTGVAAGPLRVSCAGAET